MAVEPNGATYYRNQGQCIDGAHDGDTYTVKGDGTFGITSNHNETVLRLAWSRTSRKGRTDERKEARGGGAVRRGAGGGGVVGGVRDGAGRGPHPVTKALCQDSGWQRFVDANGATQYRNQGQCIDGAHDGDTYTVNGDGTFGSLANHNETVLRLA